MKALDPEVGKHIFSVLHNSLIIKIILSKATKEVVVEEVVIMLQTTTHVPHVKCVGREDIPQSNAITVLIRHTKAHIPPWLPT